MSDATCRTCPWWEQCPESLVQAEWFSEHDKGDCRRHAPIPSPEDATPWWPPTAGSDWCGEHPDRQPHLECATATLFTVGDDGPSAAGVRRIVDALEKMASSAARVRP